MKDEGEVKDDNRRLREKEKLSVTGSNDEKLNRIYLNLREVTREFQALICFFSNSKN